MRFIAALMLFSVSLCAQPLWVEKQRFTLDNFSTENGQTITQVAVGWEAYGKLNADKSNVILITHYFSGSSHAAGKYHQDDAAAGVGAGIEGVDRGGQRPRGDLP